MSKGVTFVYSGGDLTIYTGNGGRALSVSQDHPSYSQIKTAVKNGESEEVILALFNVQKAVENFVSGKAEVRDGQVYFNGSPVHNAISTRIVQFMKEGFKFEHLLRFMEKLDKNPSYQSKQELFDFLEHKHLPITDDGCFMAFKAVRADYTDKHSGKFDNSPGKVVSMNRGDVDDNRSVGCSKGLHVGALDYVSSFGDGDDRIVVVKVDPADAVSVPTDCTYTKLRTCRYEVLRDFEGELNNALYGSRGEELKSPVSDDEDFWDDFEDEDEYDDDEDDSELEDSWLEDDEDDEYDEDDIQVDDASPSQSTYGVRPNGSKFHNKRDSSGRFTRK